MYLWAVVAAHDLALINTQRANQLAGATLAEVATLKRYDGMLYQWYDTNNGNVLLNPGQGDCTETTPRRTTARFASAVDNGWYASGLIEVREALPACSGSRRQPAGADGLLDLLRQPAADRLRRHLVAARCPADRQQYGGFYVDQGPAGYHNGALYTDPRISRYIGMAAPS